MLCHWAGNKRVSSLRHFINQLDLTLKKKQSIGSAQKKIQSIGNLAIAGVVNFLKASFMPPFFDRDDGRLTPAWIFYNQKRSKQQVLLQILEEGGAS
jgi:hypothetical protein